MDRAELEGIAARALDDVGRTSPVDLFELARDYGFEIRFSEEASICGNVIHVDPSLRPERQRWDAGHELAHALIEEAGLDADDEQAVQYLTGALLFPWIDFRAQVRRVGRDPWKLKELHPLASHEAIARRIVAACGPAVLWVWDLGPGERDENIYKVVTPGWRWPYRRPAAIEWEALRAALENGAAPVEPIGGIMAWAVIEPPRRRVLCLSDGEVLYGIAAPRPADEDFS